MKTEITNSETGIAMARVHLLATTGLVAVNAKLAMHDSIEFVVVVRFPIAKRLPPKLHEPISGRKCPTKNDAPIQITNGIQRARTVFI
jgi:hypothetical protein